MSDLPVGNYMSMYKLKITCVIVSYTESDYCKPFFNIIILSNQLNLPSSIFEFMLGCPARDIICKVGGFTW